MVHNFSHSFSHHFYILVYQQSHQTHEYHELNESDLRPGVRGAPGASTTPGSRLRGDLGMSPTGEPELVTHLL